MRDCLYMIECYRVTCCSRVHRQVPVQVHREVPVRFPENSTSSGINIVIVHQGRGSEFRHTLDGSMTTPESRGEIGNLVELAILATIVKENKEFYKQDQRSGSLLHNFYSPKRKQDCKKKLDHKSRHEIKPLLMSESGCYLLLLIQKISVIL